jgi:hypothetical protein
MSRVLLKSGLVTVIDAIRDGRPRLQQAFLNILNLVYASAYWERGTSAPMSQNTGLGISGESPLMSTRVYFAKSHSTLVPILARLVEQGSTFPIRAKALLAIQFICRFRPSIANYLCDRRLLSTLSKLVDPSDQDENPPISPRGDANGRTAATSTYISKCAACVINFAKELWVTSIHGIIKNMIRAPSSSGTTNATPQKGAYADGDSPKKSAYDRGAKGTPDSDTSVTVLDSEAEEKETLEAHCAGFKVVIGMMVTPALRRQIVSAQGLIVLGQAVTQLGRLRERGGKSLDLNTSYLEESLYLGIECVAQVIQYIIITVIECVFDACILFIS